MFFIREEDIIRWCEENELEFIRCACRFTEKRDSYDDVGQVSKRAEVKKLIRELRKRSPYIEMNIFRSVENVNVNTVIAYKRDGVKHHFLEDYDIQ